MLAAESRRPRGSCPVSGLRGGSVGTSRLLLDFRGELSRFVLFSRLEVSHSPFIQGHLFANGEHSSARSSGADRLSALTRSKFEKKWPSRSCRSVAMIHQP